MNANHTDSTTVSPETAKSAVKVVLAVCEAIRELGSVEPGTLYGHLCGHFTLTQFESILGMLVRTGMIRREQRRIVWIGPAIS